MRHLHRLAVGLFRRWMLLRARDTTKASADRSAVIIAAHADDETLGCGVSIWHKTQRGTPVWIVIASDGAAERTSLIDDDADLPALRQQEALGALGALGVPPNHIRFLGFPDGALPDHREQLTSALEHVLRELPADDLLMPALLDGHADHAELTSILRSLHHAGRVTGRMLQYPVWYWESLPRFRLARSTRRAATFPFQMLEELIRPVRRVRASEADRLQKRAALEQYRSQIRWEDVGRTPYPLSGALVADFIEHDELFFP